MVFAMQREIKKRATLYGAVAILLAIIFGSLCYNLGSIPQIQLSQPSIFKAFGSTEEIKDYLTTNSGTYDPFLFVGPADTNVAQLRTMIESSSDSFATPSGLAQESAYSTTNIQVSGVDEADIVKTDGEYLYVISGANVFILKAYPSDEAEILSKIVFNDTNIVGIFVSESGERLAVLGSKYRFPKYSYGDLVGSVVIDVKTFLNVYDISNKSAPSPLTNFTMTGSYFNSRMIGNYVYFVVSQPAYIILETVILPKIVASDGIREINASQVFYSEASDDYFMYTTIIAMNIQDITEEPAYKTLMLGGTSSMYVSPNNIYITFPEPYGKTTIYRIRIENSTISPEAKGTVAGRELNQFSMDEYDSHFRIATTTRIDWTTTHNNLYTLNMNLSIVGKLENIAPNETIDSARFIGNRCYLSTSVVQRDPFFVIDVENATEPRVLGYLKIPGFTRYLHPYDEDHIIGVGRDAGHIKISIFDVTNVSAPIEMDMYSIQGGWSDTPVLTDHKAFLFDKSKDLLAIPISAHLGYYPEYWQFQGLYVFNITLSQGIILRGNVTHQDGVEYWDSSYWVKRALYIENVLYTISDKKVKLNNLEDLALIEEITLN